MDEAPPNPTPCGETCLALLADPTRRDIVHRLRAGPCPVGRLAEGLPVSRPAVSQHLRLLAEAGLVRCAKRGRQRFYGLDPRGAQVLRSFLDQIWDAGWYDEVDKGWDMACEIDTAETGPDPDSWPPVQSLEPVKKILHVALDPDAAFVLFTADLGRWWPVAAHSLSAQMGAVPIKVEVGQAVGGQIVETCADGRQRAWARITAWKPGAEFGARWHVGGPEAQASDLRLGLSAAPGGCRISLVHSGWERLGTGAADSRSQYLTGWDVVLVDCFGAACLEASVEGQSLG